MVAVLLGCIRHCAVCWYLEMICPMLIDRQLVRHCSVYTDWMTGRCLQFSAVIVNVMWSNLRFNCIGIFLRQCPIVAVSCVAWTTVSQMCGSFFDRLWYAVSECSCTVALITDALVFMRTLYTYMMHSLAFAGCTFRNGSNVKSSCWCTPWYLGTLIPVANLPGRRTLCSAGISCL